MQSVLRFSATEQEGAVTACFIDEPGVHACFGLATGHVVQVSTSLVVSAPTPVAVIPPQPRPHPDLQHGHRGVGVVGSSLGSEHHSRDRVEEGSRGSWFHGHGGGAGNCGECRD